MVVSQPEWLTPAEAARYLNTTIAALAQRRYLKAEPAFEKVNGRVRYRRSEVQSLAKVSRPEPNTSVAPEPLLTATQVSAWLSVTESALGHMRFRGTGPAFVVIGQRAVRYRLDDVEQYLQAQTRSVGWKGW